MLRFVEALFWYRSARVRIVAFSQGNVKHSNGKVRRDDVRLGLGNVWFWCRSAMVRIVAFSQGDVRQFEVSSGQGMVWSYTVRRCVGLAEPCRGTFSGGQVQKRPVKSCSDRVR